MKVGNKPVAVHMIMFKMRGALGTNLSQLNEKENGWEERGGYPSLKITFKEDKLPTRNYNHL